MLSGLLHLWPYRIDGDAITLVFGFAKPASVRLIYAGPRLPDEENLNALERSLLPLPHGSQPDLPCPTNLWPQSGSGYPGLPAIMARRGDALLPISATPHTHRVAGRSCHVNLVDPAAGIAIALNWEIGSGDVIRTRATVTNKGHTPLALDRIASLAFPLPGWATHHTCFHGRWAGEMRETRGAIPYGRSGGESRGGRPGFGGANWRIVHEANFGTDHGQAIALHMAWSGDHETVVERDADGTSIQMGLRLDPGEIILSPGESFTTPDAVVALVDRGRNSVRNALHRHLRETILPDRATWPARKVHLNSWEAVAFDMDDMRLARLADAGSAIGVERFVVDDGWFIGRANDQTSLGDWSADPVRFPKGLDRLIEYVGELNMDFGLWVEPEMVSPDSALYRAHPDWCIHRANADRPAQRHQLVLDLARAEVSEHLFNTLDGLLSRHQIAYLKWDHNRDLFPNDGTGYRQTRALHDLLDRLRVAHPQVEIESCASGGGRIDYAMLNRCSRVWPSDNNDAIERLRINRSWSLFLPLEIIGNHVGPSPNPLTGRVLPMDFRAKVAMFGHMGVEADPAILSGEDRATLALHIAFYKEHRAFLHSGDLHEISLGDPGLFGSLIIQDNEALAFVSRTDFAADYNSPPVCFPGLDNGSRYVVSFPLATGPLACASYELSGQMLSSVGIVLPLSRPASAVLIRFQRLEIPA